MISIIISGIMIFFSILELLVIINALMSWFIPPGGSGFSRLLGSIVDPIQEPFSRLQQRYLPNLPIDFSPVIVILIIIMLRNIIAGLFY